MKKQLIYPGALLVAITIVMAFTLPGNSTTDKTEEKTPKKEAKAADNYKVIKVNGKIIYQKSGNDLKQGDVFAANTKLDFKSPQSRAAVISSLKGRFVLTSSSNSNKPNLLPAMNNMSSRAGALLNMIDLKNHFSGNYLAIGKMELSIGEEAFPLDNENFFYVQYEYNGETIPKKLPKNADENKVIFDAEEIFKIDGKPVDVDPTSMTLYYRKVEEKKSIKINDFKPVFPNQEALKTEVQIIIDEFEQKSDTEKIDEITAYLNEFYGKPDKENLAEWLAENFDLKK